MKHCKSFFTKGLLLVLLMCSALLYSQNSFSQNTVTGIVKDSRGDALIGVSVTVKGTKTGTVTDIDGKYSLSLTQSNPTLVFSYLGFTPQEHTLGGRKTLDIILKEKEDELDEVVVVGYGTQKRISVSAAVSQVDGKELLKAPATSISNLIGGRISGVVTLQQSGQPGLNGAGVLVRGSSVKYIVDGNERAFDEIDPNDIESISVLKDAASAAVYGLNSEAVMIITTKRGKEGASRITFSGTYGISTNAKMLEMLDGPSYAYWYNKALEMDGNSPIFTSEHIEKMRNNLDGWGNTNWYKKTFGTGYNTNINMNASGGTDKIKYFASVGYNNQEGNVKGFDYNRVNLRSNIDAQIAKNLTLSVDISGRVAQTNSPLYGAKPADWNNIPQQAMRALPFVPETYDGLPVSTRTASTYVSPLAASSESGYTKGRNNSLNSKITLKYDIPYVQGLSAKFDLAYDYADNISKQFSTPYYTNVATLPSDPSRDITYVKSVDSRGANASLTEGLTHGRSVMTNTSLRYENKFGQHHITGLALMETIQNDGNKFGATGYGFNIYELDELDRASMADKTKISGSSSLSRLVGFLGRVNYGYAEKYLLEVSTRYDGTYSLPGKRNGGNRWVLTPAASLAWRMTGEDWFQEAFPYVDNLKLRASIGQTATTGGLPAYYYLGVLGGVENAAVIGGANIDGLQTQEPPNLNLKWAKTLQYNGGIDLSMWNGLLSLEFDIFYKYIYDLPTQVSGSYPDSFGGYFHKYVSENRQDHKGFEITLEHRNKIGDFFYRVKATGTYAKSRWLYYANDSQNTPDWLKLTGKETGSQVGFIALGLFQSQEEIDNSALIPGKAVRVGDIKYLDRNGDGVITYDQDRGYVGKSPYPKFSGGLQLDAEWKGFDFSALFHAGLGRDVALTGVYSTGVMDNTSMTKPFYHGGNSPTYLLENSWTEENPNAEFPRLAIVTASSNNAYSSTFWYRNGDYLRLRSLQLGYNFPANITKKMGMQLLRLYVEGQNLLTVSELTKYNIDPEQPGVSNGYYPQQKVYSVGLKITF